MASRPPPSELPGTRIGRGEGLVRRSLDARPLPFDPRTYRMPEQTTTAVQRLMDQYTEIARLAGGLAHEIKNPLSTIRLNMELLAEDLEEEPSPRQQRSLRRVATMQKECQRLQDLLDDFLNFAKVRQLTLQPTSLNRELDDVFDFFAPEAAEAGVELVVTWILSCRRCCWIASRSAVRC